MVQEQSEFYSKWFQYDKEMLKHYMENNYSYKTKYYTNELKH